MNYLSLNHTSRNITLLGAAILSLLLHGCASHSAPKITTLSSPAEKEAIVPPEPTAVAAASNELETPAPVQPEPSIFLKQLSETDLINIRKEAMRTTLPIWESIDSRSQKVRFRVIEIINSLNAPHELLFIPVAESGYNPYALSPAGAFGLWQLMPRTAIELGALHRNGIDGRRNIESSTKAAVSYLLSLYQRFDSWPLAICAYNLGPWGVERRLKKRPWTYEMGLDNLPFPAETRHYVKQILGMVALAEDGILSFSSPTETQTFQVSAPIDLKHLENTSGLEQNELFKLNPGLDYQHYIHHDLNIHLPAENINKLQLALKDNPGIFKPKYISIHIKEGDSLWAIARRHHTSIRHLKQLNPNLDNTLSIGKSITVPASTNLSTASSKSNPLLSKGRRIRYKVKSGDSLWTIAKKFGTTSHSIARTNQIAKHQLIRPGDKLWIVARFKPR